MTSAYTNGRFVEQLNTRLSVVEEKADRTYKDITELKADVKAVKTNSDKIKVFVMVVAVLSAAQFGLNLLEIAGILIK